jgi:hypothetical protein
MSKNPSSGKSSEHVQTSVATRPGNEVVLTPFWLLNAGTAKKLGQHSTGILDYQVLTGNDRRDLLIAISRNEGGGYFSREPVPFPTIVKCLEKYKSGAPFVSKILKDVFVSKSANNAGFMAAVMHALGLLTPASEARTKHAVTGDWAAWEKSMLAEPGTGIELPPEICGEQPVENSSPPTHREHKKPLELPVKKSQ